MPTTIAVFNQPNINGSGVGDLGDENSNLLSIVQNEIDNGGDYAINDLIVNFTDTANLQTQLSGSDYFFMTDMEVPDPTDASFLPAAAVTILHDYVNAGGVIVQTGTFGSKDVDFLNTIFNLNLASASGTSWSKNSSNTSGTDFDSGPATLVGPSATDSIDASSIANGTYTSYYDDGSDANSVLGKIEYGSGAILFVGFDYYGAGFNTDWGPGPHVNGFQNTSDYVTFVLPAMLSNAATLASGGAPAAPVDSGGGGDFTSPAPVVVDNTPADPAPAGTNIQPTDDDGDGLREVVTAADGTTVDGNRDGISDADQTQVAGLRLINDGAAGSDYGALVVPDGIQLQAVTLSTAAADGSIPVTTVGGGTVVTTTPEGITNAFAGVISFNAAGVTPGGTTTATISFLRSPAGTGNAYLRFNYSTNRFEEFVDANGNPLYTFIDSDGDGTVDGVSLTLTDGDPNWDGDGVANGTVVDPGFFGSGERIITGTKRGDSLIGNVLANIISGLKGNDWLVGDLGNDILKGSRGKDGLYGGEGADLITGGKDRDRIYYTDASESTIDQRDTVKFGKVDRFVFSSFDGDSTTEGQQMLSFIGKQAFSGTAGELRATRSVLEADTNGDGLADFAVNLNGNALITASNLVL